MKKQKLVSPLIPTSAKALNDENRGPYQPR